MVIFKLEKKVLQEAEEHTGSQSRWTGSNADEARSTAPRTGDKRQGKCEEYLGIELKTAKCTNGFIRDRNCKHARS